MVTVKSVEEQLKKIRFNRKGWGRSEAEELPHILLPEEKISECVNGVYEGGFALLVATDVRVLLVDKKPLNYLTVEDLRFDMITEIDYSHRLFGARISISSGSKNMKFTSYNQQRLRKLIGHVQHRMAELKKEQSDHQVDQKQHLEQINQQLQAYLLAQYKQQEDLRKQLEDAKNKGTADIAAPEPVKPSPELSDFLFAQTLLEQYRQNESGALPVKSPEPAAQLPATAVSQEPVPLAPAPASASPEPNRQSDSQLADLYAEGMKEIFGKHQPSTQNLTEPASKAPAATAPPVHTNPLEINPLRIAYSKLPMALRNRKFGRPSFHAHSQAPTATPTQTQVAGAQ